MMPDREPKNDTERRVNALLIAVDMTSDSASALQVLRVAMLESIHWEDLLPVIEAYMSAEISMIQSCVELVELCMSIDEDNEAKSLYPSLIHALQKRIGLVKENLKVIKRGT